MHSKGIAFNVIVAMAAGLLVLLLLLYLLSSVVSEQGEFLITEIASPDEKTCKGVMEEVSQALDGKYSFELITWPTSAKCQELAAKSTPNPKEIDLKNLEEGGNFAWLRTQEASSGKLCCIYEQE